MPLDQHTNTLYDLDLRFPPLPRTVAEISSILASPEGPDTEKLIDVVNQDPLVVATVLKRINSAYYGMKKKFGDLRKAVVMIGFIEVSNIVLTTSYIGLRKLGSSKKEKLAVDHMIRASIGTGYFANLLAEEFNVVHKPIAFTTGLMHNIGRFVLLYNHPEAYIDLIDHCTEYLPPIHQERDLLGIDHSSIGAIATQYWNFPDLLPKLIESYETPGHLNDPDERELGIIIQTSAHIAHHLAFEIEKHPDWASGDEDLEQQDSDSVFPLDWELPSFITPILKERGYEKEELVELLTSKQRAALEYIEHMVKH